MWTCSSCPFGCLLWCSEKVYQSILKKKLRDSFFILCHRLPQMSLVKSHNQMHQFTDWKDLQCHCGAADAVMLLLASEAVLGSHVIRLSPLQGFLLLQHPATSLLSTWEDSSWSLHFQSKAFKFDPFKSLKFTCTITSTVQSNPGLRWK